MGRIADAPRVTPSRPDLCHCAKLQIARRMAHIQHCQPEGLCRSHHHRPEPQHERSFPFFGFPLRTRTTALLPPVSSNLLPLRDRRDRATA